MTVAALYIDPRGPYPKLADVDCWDEKRDARKYPGPYPIVAHPPCGPWGSLANFSRQDPALALCAVEQVRRFGGVLEHPRGSRLWPALGLPRPGELPDAYGGITLLVRQVDWGHVAEKPTWIYLVRVRVVPAFPPPGTATHWVCGSRNQRPRAEGGTLPAGMKFCSNEQRRRTPPRFAEFLVALARSVGSPGRVV